MTDNSERFSRFLKRPFSTFLLLWAPLLFSLVAEPLSGLVDTAFVARLGADELAALGVGTMTLTSCLWIFNFLCVGTQTAVAQALGKKDLQKARDMATLALSLALVLGIILAALIWISAPWLAGIMGAGGIVYEGAVEYIRIRALAGPAVLLIMAANGIFYGRGEMRLPLFFAVAVNGANIVLDALLIFGVGPFPSLGIGGAAAASSISQWAGVLCCLLFLRQRVGFSRHISPSDAGALLRVGRDMILRTASIFLFLLLATRAATQLGTDSGAAHQAIRQVWMFSSLFLDAAAITAQSLIAHFVGAGNIRVARRVTRLVCLMSLVIGSCLCLGMVSFSGVFAMLLVPAASRYLFFPAWYTAALFQPVAACAFATDGVHWGCGDFRFLRNGVIVATVVGVAGLVGVAKGEMISLTCIWVCVGVWLFIRALLGILRIWPGMKGSPLVNS